MTVSSQTSEQSFPGPSAATTYPLTFRFFSNSDIQAFLVDDATGLITDLVYGVDYTLTGASLPEIGGNAQSVLTKPTGIPAGSTMWVQRVMQIEQQTDITNQGEFYPEIHENVFDRLTMLIQQGFSGLSRALLRPLGLDYFDAESRIISNVADPEKNNDAANKHWTQQYVGSVINSGSGPINNAANVIYVPPSGVSETVKSALDTIRNRFIHVADYGAACNGVADDTLPVLSAISAARAFGVPLLMSGSIRFVAASIPAGSKYPGSGGSVVAGCSMVGYPRATLTIEGAIGFDMSGVANTVVSNLDVVTTGVGIAESGTDTAFPKIFQATGATQRKSVVYSGLRLFHTVSASDGSFRGPWFISESNVSGIVVENIELDNGTTCIFVGTSSDISIENVVARNCQTPVYLEGATNYSVRDVFLTNTSAQSMKWVGRTNAVPRAKNGFDAVLVGNGNHGVVEGIEAEWPIERCVYLQSSNLTVSNCKCLNGDGFKLVGSSRDNPAYNIKANNLHLTIGQSYPLTGNLFCITSYFSNDVDINNCTILNYGPNVPGTGILFTGSFPYTSRNFSIRDCVATNCGTIAYIDLMPQTAAELAAIDPTQTFLVLDQLSIRNCRIKTHESLGAFIGAITSMRDASGSADAKAAYALRNVDLQNNVIQMGTDRNRWLFDARYVDTLRSVNNVPDNYFLNTTAPVITAPSTKIFMDEPNLVQNPNIRAPGLFSAMSTVTAVAGSTLKFTIPGANPKQVSTLTLPGDGAFSRSIRTLELYGYGAFYNTGSAVNVSLELDIGTGKYLGKITGATKTDILGTPPLTVTPAAADLSIRGDLAPTTPYYAKLNFV